MPRENRKRGKKRQGNAEEVNLVVHDAQHDAEPENAAPQWMHTNDEPNLDAPFGYVEADVKAYFRTVDSKIQEWQSQDYRQEAADDEGDTSEGIYGLSHIHSINEIPPDKRTFLVAALSESSGKERQLATDPDCAIILERMLHSTDDFVKRVFADRLCDS
jgi:nucleolar protein 9